MENQHRLIKGYRDLTETEIKSVNLLKEQAARVGITVEQLQKEEGLDQRWISIGKTHLQQGFMALIRGVAQPDSF